MGCLWQQRNATGSRGADRPFAGFSEEHDPREKPNGRAGPGLPLPCAVRWPRSTAGSSPSFRCLSCRSSSRTPLLKKWNVRGHDANER